MLAPFMFFTLRTKTHAKKLFSCLSEGTAPIHVPSFLSCLNSSLMRLFLPLLKSIFFVFPDILVGSN